MYGNATFKLAKNPKRPVKIKAEEANIKKGILAFLAKSSLEIIIFSKGVACNTF